MEILQVERDIHNTIDQLDTITLDKLFCETDRDLRELQEEEIELFATLNDLFNERLKLSLH